MTQDGAGVLLQSEREQTLRRLVALGAEFDGIVDASLDANSDDEHDPEGATIAFERERTAALRAQAQVHLGEVDRALARVAAGQYGECSACQHPIAAERLSALPVTELCVACASTGSSPIGRGARS